mmetsp:Transcript_43465/g.129811  ORF Transcript_43465/g.129811 Transcript_43465/m.129811 type:complete len:287 (+) Transcript_43465:428-1288(+)
MKRRRRPGRRWRSRSGRAPFHGLCADDVPQPAVRPEGPPWSPVSRPPVPPRGPWRKQRPGAISLQPAALLQRSAAQLQALTLVSPRKPSLAAGAAGPAARREAPWLLSPRKLSPSATSVRPAPPPGRLASPLPFAPPLVPARSLGPAVGAVRLAAFRRRSLERSPSGPKLRRWRSVLVSAGPRHPISPRCLRPRLPRCPRPSTTCAASWRERWRSDLWRSGSWSRGCSRCGVHWHRAWTSSPSGSTLTPPLCVRSSASGRRPSPRFFPAGNCVPRCGGRPFRRPRA